MGDKSKTNRTSVVVIVIVAILMIGVCIAAVCYKLLGPVGTFVDLKVYLGLSSADEYAISVNMVQSSYKAKQYEDTVYLPLDMVTSSIDERFYYDSSVGAILYAMPTQLMTIKPNEKSYELGGVSMDSYYCPFLMAGSDKYIASSFVTELSGCSINIYDEESTVVVWDVPDTQKDMTVSVLPLKGSSATVRTQATIRGSIVKNVTSDDILYVVDSEEDWHLVMTDKGLHGYVKSSQVRADAVQSVTMMNSSKYEYTNISMEDDVVLVWHQVSSPDAAAQTEAMQSRMANTQGVNVISPTWYSLAAEEGYYSSTASAQYVEAAHALGLQVWALVNNFNNEVNNYKFLSTYEYRQRFIKGIIAEALSYGIDGINVDFEAGSTGYGGISKDCGPAFLQFLRELSIECRNNSLVLSVDNYVPMPYNMYYDRTEQGRIVDYVIVMGYDEHYAGSEAGSVASYDFVKNGIVNTLAEVSPSKVINAIPFYTRLYNIDDAGVALGSEAKSMSAMSELLSAAGAEVIWDDVTKQNYSQFVYNDLRYVVWLENEASVQWKMDLIEEHNLAGVACWKLGLETSDMWSIIND